MELWGRRLSRGVARLRLRPRLGRRVIRLRPTVGRLGRGVVRLRPRLGRGVIRLRPRVGVLALHIGIEALLLGRGYVFRHSSRVLATATSFLVLGSAARCNFC